MKKFILTVFFLVICSTKIISAMHYDAYVAKVIQVIDGDSIKIKDLNGEISYIKLIGLNSQGNDQAFNYLNNEILGKSLIISHDAAFINNYNRWSYAYVYDNEIFINKLILEKGYAMLDENYKPARLYNTLKTAASFAQQKNVGMWSDNNIYTTDKNNKININTASIAMLQDYLGFDFIAAKNIIRYREKEPFRNVSDILYVSGITSDIYYNKIFMMVTTTNINTASHDELLSLEDLTNSEATNIIEYRERYGFSDITDLYKRGIITKSKFDRIRNFITLR